MILRHPHRRRWAMLISIGWSVVLVSGISWLHRDHILPSLPRIDLPLPFGAALTAGHTSAPSCPAPSRYFAVLGRWRCPTPQRGADVYTIWILWWQPLGSGMTQSTYTQLAAVRIAP